MGGRHGVSRGGARIIAVAMLTLGSWACCDDSPAGVGVGVDLSRVEDSDRPIEVGDTIPVIGTVEAAGQTWFCDPLLFDSQTHPDRFSFESVSKDVAVFVDRDRLVALDTGIVLVRVTASGLTSKEMRIARVVEPAGR